MKKIAILGSTGSIGTQALDIIERNRSYFKIEALSAHNNIELLKEQIDKFKPRVVTVVDKEKAEILKSKISSKTEILVGPSGLKEIASIKNLDMVLVAVVGIAGLEATIAALSTGNDVALANKETLVAGGQLVMNTAKVHGSSIIPVDSEHSAILQCIQGARKKDIKGIVLTASGGPFRGYTREDLEKVTVEDALKHPNWVMGQKITIDSATLMNKGLELIEAKWLFDLDIEQIKVVIHPESIIHSMVEFIDNSVLAQLGLADMRIPILYALTYPERMPSPVESLDLLKLKKLSFEEADLETFSCLKLAINAIEIGGTMPVVLNAANEIAVKKFLDRKIGFNEIASLVKEAMKNHKPINEPVLEDILRVDQAIRKQYS
ncbi:MAG: 1-deoxy-D-xylulose-5-phosphate reductoisomerase [Clostridiales bacterium]|nr:1-deoxy-D-xylulose-5-phosphate reductoisomerase [Bacillota bacterium]NLH57964.1 1-deoxy-D-xylulose-5-phosphate reductoisomerase [Clostridiales bacterium]